MKIAIPKFDSKVAPCFETASYFFVAEIENGQEVWSQIVSCAGCEGYGRVRLLRDNKIDLIICNGIKNFYQDLLESSGIAVIPETTSDIKIVFEKFLTGELKHEKPKPDLTSLGCDIPHEDLVCWAREFFENHGYQVEKTTRGQPFPIDLIAEIQCPVCCKKIKVAICCGAHTYRIDREIREFHFVAPTHFDSQVYVYPGRSDVEKYCQDYGIELIDPDADLEHQSEQGQNLIPILQNPINGHEKIFRETN